MLGKGFNMLMRQFHGKQHSSCDMHARLHKSSRYYREVLDALSSFPFYNTYVHLPPRDAPVPGHLYNNPKFYPYLKDVLGAIDGTHIRCTPSAADRQLARDRKGQVTQNTLAVCGFDMVFYYIVSGWDGSASDSYMYNDARLVDFVIPDGKCYLADAGFAQCDALLVPYRGVRYHLAEWGRASVR